uniref:Uncharacterized protein n=1 Tax=Triticum urartu TaxID=4572 RepID=A0A8R7U385_TRIUA
QSTHWPPKKSHQRDLSPFRSPRRCSFQSLDSYDLVDEDLRGVEAEPRLDDAGAESSRRGEGPEASSHVLAAAKAGRLRPIRRRGLGGARRGGGLRRLVVHARRLRAVGVEPGGDAHAHVQQLHVLRHLDRSIYSSSVAGEEAS